MEEIARDLRRANIETRAVADISRFKRAKLVIEPTFVLDALYPPSQLRDRAAALAARGGADDPDRRRRRLADLVPGDGQRRRSRSARRPGYEYGGTSTWQSLARSGSLETDFINGEVVLQARLAGPHGAGQRGGRPADPRGRA